MFPCAPELTDVIVETLDLPYRVYADPDRHLYTAYQTRFSAGAPLPAWIIIDPDGIIRFLWRATGGGLYDHYPEGQEILDQIRQIGGS